jgi:hypothetical protein
MWGGPNKSVRSQVICGRLEACGHPPPRWAGSGDEERPPKALQGTTSVADRAGQDGPFGPSGVSASAWPARSRGGHELFFF